jgi:hypothetical protein
MTDAEQRELKSHSVMLGQICAEVDGWVEHEQTTTLQAVRLMKAEIYELRAYKLRNEVWKTYTE